jgi:hypothetical protein
MVAIILRFLRRLFKSARSKYSVLTVLYEGSEHEMKANDRAIKIVNSYTDPDKKNAASTWLDICNSPTAFLKSWHLGREVRKLAFLISGKPETCFRTGLVTTKHIALAIQRLAKRVKPKKMKDSRNEFIAALLLVGAWALRIAAEFLAGIPLRRPRASKLNIATQYI